MSKIHDCERNSSPMISIGTIEWYTREIRELIFFLKLYPNFTRHYLITHTYLVI